jgi:hypothetical protein
MTVNVGGVQQRTGHLARTWLIVPIADGILDVRQANRAHGADVALRGTRQIRHSTGVHDAYAIWRRRSLHRLYVRLVSRGKNASNFSGVFDFHGESPFA